MVLYTYTTICLRPRRGLRMNLRVRNVTGWSRSAMFAIVNGQQLPTSEMKAQWVEFCAYRCLYVEVEVLAR